MMKTMEKTIQISSGSQIGEVEAAGFNATINSVDPLNMGISTCVCDPEVYKANISQCRADENEFRAYVQSLQDEMLEALELPVEELEEQE